MSIPSNQDVSKNNGDCSAALAHGKNDQNARFAAVEDISAHLSTVIKELEPAEDEALENPGRVKTRLLNFGFKPRPEPEATKESEEAESPVIEAAPLGWIAVIDGPGRGNSFCLVDEVSQIGRGEGQAIQLGFGDDYISRENHASIVYRPKKREFELHFNGKANPVRLNKQKVIGVELLRSGDRIRIGISTLRFLALCDEHFAWTTPEE